MNDIYAHVSVRILEKEYQVSCPANERTDLLDSAEILNAKMREIRDSGKVVGLERIAVMAALNMANELLHAKAKDKSVEGDFSQSLKLMSDREESVLYTSKHIDRTTAVMESVNLHLVHISNHAWKSHDTT